MFDTELALKPNYTCTETHDKLFYHREQVRRLQNKNALFYFFNFYIN